jgi:hypothetical protein
LRLWWHPRSEPDDGVRAIVKPGGAMLFSDEVETDRLRAQAQLESLARQRAAREEIARADLAEGRPHKQAMREALLYGQDVQALREELCHLRELLRD